MSQKLFESDELVFNLRSIYSNESEATADTGLPAKGDWKGWGELLKARIEDNKDSENKMSDYDLETEFFTEFYKANWPADVAEKLFALGEPLRRAIKVLGFNPGKEKGGNPLLAFMLQQYVQDTLLKTNLLNVVTFKAIYNAVAKKLVADSEFFTSNNYNIIYCPALYKKTPKEMIEYLEQQSHILTTKEYSYPESVQETNKKVFLYIKSIEELDTKKRADKIKELSTSGITNISTATLNDIDLIKAIRGHTSEITHMSAEKQDKITSKLTTVSQIFAALVALSVNAKNDKATAALANEKFDNMPMANIITAAQDLASKQVIPAGKLQKEEVDTLVDKLVARLQSF